jgi:tetrahydromethanopterin S-methyltransferase subunit G
MAVIFGICYAMAGDSTYGNNAVTAGASKRVGAGILTFYVLVIGAIVSIIYTEFSKIFK